MYKPVDNKSQQSFFGFNQFMGRHMNPNNRCIKMATSIHWDEFEVKYAGLFSSLSADVAKPLWMVTKFQYSNRELVE